MKTNHSEKYLVSNAINLGLYVLGKELINKLFCKSLYTEKKLGNSSFNFLRFLF